MKWLHDRFPSLLVVPDVGLVLFGLPVAHGITAEIELSASGSELGSTLIVVAAYLVALGTHGRYTAASTEDATDHRLSTGTVSAGTGLLLALAASTETLPFAFAPHTMIVHGLLTIVGLISLQSVLKPAPGSTSSASPDTPVASSSRPDIALNDLVPRPSLGPPPRPLRSFLSTRTLLVTGAGGSIGSELSAQLARLDPDRLVLVDVSEQNLHQLETALQAQVSGTDVAFELADVRDESRMSTLLRRERPDAVLHTAAYKHVHLMERHPIEAVENNTMATARLLQLCENHEVGQFVFVSTDKAVHPQSVLGATKRWAEWYVRTARPPLHARTVRFGNVFGSEGSVVPHFLDKLTNGEPLPVTHPDMERYFMTAEEASRLILQTLLLDTYPTYILKMGDPIRIQWLAEQLIERWTPNASPDDMIEYVGCRPGEKLSEQLVCDDESVCETKHSSILGLQNPAPHCRDTLDTYFRHVQSVAEPPSADRERIRRLLLETPPSVPTSLT